jgi:hypothetical protein
MSIETPKTTINHLLIAVISRTCFESWYENIALIMRSSLLDLADQVDKQSLVVIVVIG